MIFDDTVQEKPYTDENEVMCRHYDHNQGKAVQGFNLLNCVYHVGDISIPVAFELIRKPLEYCDLKTRKQKRASLVTKNELMRSMLDVCGVAKLWVNEVFDVSLVVGKQLLVQLPTIESKDKQLQGSL